MTSGHDETLPDAEAAAAIHGAGWRLLLGGAYSSVEVVSLPGSPRRSASSGW